MYKIIFDGNKTAEDMEISIAGNYKTTHELAKDIYKIKLNGTELEQAYELGKYRDFEIITKNGIRLKNSDYDFLNAEEAWMKEYILDAENGKHQKGE